MTIVPLTISPTHPGSSLRDALTAVLGDAAEAARLIARGSVWVNGVRVRDPEMQLPADAAIVVQRPPDGVYRNPIVTPEMILYEDDDLIALDKPVNTYVEATPWDAEGHLRAALARFLAARDGSAPPLHLAHRLDRDTSGVLLLSKTPDVNAALQRAFREGTVRKTYLALCAGLPAFDEIEIETGHGRGRGGIFRVFPREDIGRTLPQGGTIKAMRTRLSVIRRMDDAALVRATPLTGRTHQIRLHLAFLGHPLIGDAKYGGPSTWRGAAVQHHHLHAERLELPHPRSSAPLIIESPAPEWAR
ncbi:MAG: RluA family pseudouridine synthase [Roseiflexus sp.]|nr:RluA family pseudouridine synthase [Roseiflexus sp.]MDW8148841.1 RluA family pseudouridine synthase [Roseiflexaceae bacterium]